MHQQHARVEQRARPCARTRPGLRSSESHATSTVDRIASDRTDARDDGPSSARGEPITRRGRGPAHPRARRLRHIEDHRRRRDRRTPWWCASSAPSAAFACSRRTTCSTRRSPRTRRRRCSGRSAGRCSQRLEDPADARASPRRCSSCGCSPTPAAGSASTARSSCSPARPATSDVLALIALGIALAERRCRISYLGAATPVDALAETVRAPAAPRSPCSAPTASTLTRYEAAHAAGSSAARWSRSARRRDALAKAAAPPRWTPTRPTTAARIAGLARRESSRRSDEPSPTHGAT